MWDFNYSSVKDIGRVLDQESLGMMKKFGQNFLFSQSARERIVCLLNPQEGDRVWEIGPGIGSITSLLLKRGVSLTAFEIDHGFCRILSDEAFGDENTFTLIEGDALKTLFTQEERPDYICGNLPYNVGSVCIARLIEAGITVSRMVFTLQKEVVERMCASPGSDAWSSFSILTQTDYVNRLAFTIPRSCFYPSPNVDSAVVVMERRESPLVSDDIRNDFLSLVRQLFSQRRKTVRNNLSSAFSKDRLEEAFRATGMSGMERAEKLSFDELVSLCRALQ